MTTPTIEQVIKHYKIIAAAQRIKVGRPCPDTIANGIRSLRGLCRAAGIPLTAPVSRINRKSIDDALVYFVARGLSRVSAISYVSQTRSVFANWCRPYYRDAGWRIPEIETPAFFTNPPNYERPSAEMLGRVKNWYACQTGEHWFAATMMLEFAMRNGDVLRLKSENFVTAVYKGTVRTSGTMVAECDDTRASRSLAPTTRVRHYLSYTPHKTALSSGRRVYWPIHDSIWQQFDEYGGLSGLDVTDETFADLNRDLRALGFTGHKGAYELRKICIDHVYQKFGAEAASSISGDNIKTIVKYYADPAQPNIGATRIIDLL